MQEKPNYTQVSNYFLDELLQNMNGSEVKVYLVITRKTIGWHKDTDAISYSQIMAMTGLSRDAVSKAIKSLEDARLITVIRSDKKTSLYTLWSEKQTTTSQKNVPDEAETGPVFGHTKESIKENKDTPQQQEKEARKNHRDTFANVWKSEHDKRYDNKYIFEKADWVQYNRYKLYDIDISNLTDMVIAWLDADPQYQRPYIKNFACRLTVAETLVAKGAKQVFQQSGPF